MPLHRCHRTLSLTAAIAIAAGPTARAATVASTWVGATSANWSNPANWSPAAAFPNNSNITDYNVTISAVTTPQNNPTADVSTSIDSLTLNSGANLTINTGITLSLTTTTLINFGNITLNGNATSGNATLSLPANGTTLLTGGGTISLTVSTYSQISGGSLTNVDNTIAGQGTIASPLTNQGSIYAVHNVVHLLNGPVWDSPLALTAPVDNANGSLFLADDGSISVHTTVTGGTLSTSSGSYLVGNGTLSNITLTATSTLNLPSGFITPSFSGNFTNLGTITNSTGNLSLNNATLTGGGTILLSNANLSGITGSFTNVNNTIRGQGTISANVTNQGTIRAEGGVLSLHTVNNSAGNISVAANTTLYCNGTISGGNITLDHIDHLFGAGQLAGAGTLQNVTLTSGSNWTLINNSPTLAGTFTNRGSITFDQSNANLTFAPAATTILNGGGTVTLTNATMSHIAGGNFTNVDNTIQGTGIISANVTNQSSIIASNGNLTLTGAVDNSNGTISVAANGTLLVNATLTGGSISLAPGSQIGGNGTISSATFSGTGTTIGAPQLNNTILTGLSTLTITAASAPRLGGTFSNAGIVTLSANTPLFLASNGTTTLTGGGTIILSSSSITSGNLTNLDNTIQGTGSITINITNQGTIIALGGNLTFSASVTGTGIVIVAPAATLRTANLTQSSLQNDGTFFCSGLTSTLGPITGNGTLSISAQGSAHLVLAPNSPTSHQSDLTAPTLRALDLANNKLIIDPASKSTTLTKLKSEIAAGDIFSSTLTPNTTLLLIDNAVANLTTFGGLPVTTNSLLLATELFGDANLDNHIDLSDLSTVLNNFGTVTPNWTSGNFDNAATIDLTDLSYVLNNFGLTNPNASASQLPTTPTPEPTSIALLTPVVWTSAFRRRPAPTRTDAP